jgi:hypothetical protein
MKTIYSDIQYEFFYNYLTENWDSISDKNKQDIINAICNYLIQ